MQSAPLNSTTDNSLVLFNSKLSHVHTPIDSPPGLNSKLQVIRVFLFELSRDDCTYIDFALSFWMTCLTIVVTNTATKGVPTGNKRITYVNFTPTYSM